MARNRTVGPRGYGIVGQRHVQRSPVLIRCGTVNRPAVGDVTGSGGVCGQIRVVSKASCFEIELRADHRAGIRVVSRWTRTRRALVAGCCTVGAVLSLAGAAAATNVSAFTA